MIVNFKNKFQKIEIKQALEKIISAADTHFMGDEMLVLNKNMHFFSDQKFNEVFCKTALNDHYKGMAWRMHVLLYASQMAMKVSGDFIECGVFRGFKSYFILSYFGELLSNRNYFLMDTFEGIDNNLSEGSPIYPAEHQKLRLHEFIVKRFSDFSNVRIVKGSVPNSLDFVQFENIAFLHLDMNSYQAEIGALERLWDHIPLGGVIVLDDFGLFSHRAQLENELPWFSEKEQPVLEFPTGQGMVIKTR